MTKDSSPPRRKFTDSFKLGQVVSIVRTRHGWFDGRLAGRIIRISDYSCAVKVEDDDEYGYNGITFDIPKPRDIR